MYLPWVVYIDYRPPYRTKYIAYCMLAKLGALAHLLSSSVLCQPVHHVCHPLDFVALLCCHSKVVQCANLPQWHAGVTTLGVPERVRRSMLGILERVRKSMLGVLERARRSMLGVLERVRKSMLGVLERVRRSILWDSERVGRSVLGVQVRFSG